MTTKKDQEGEATTPQSAAKPASRSTAGRRAQSPARASTAGGKGRGTAARAKKSQAASGKPSTRRKPKDALADETASGASEASRPQPRPLPRLMARFRDEIVPALMTEFSYTSRMQVPRLNKLVLNIGLGEALENPRALESASRDLALISGQRPVTTRARKSIAGFKIREGMAVGTTVTVRGRRMYELFDRLVTATLPRIRDFRGVSREAFDGRGSYSLGIREQVIFPEIDYNSVDRIRGLQVVIATTARTDREGLRLLDLLGMPFVRTETVSTAA